MSQKTLGYINDKLYTDCKSYKVVQLDNGKVYAVQVEKVKACEPMYESGGFCCRCINQDEVWSGNDVVEIGSLFQIVKNNKGLYGFRRDVTFQTIMYHNYDDAYKGMMAIKYPHKIEIMSKRGDEGTISRTFYSEETGNVKFVLAYNEAMKYWIITGYCLTPKFKKQTTFNVLGTGRIEPKCKYFHDFNF